MLLPTHGMTQYEIYFAHSLCSLKRNVQCYVDLLKRAKYPRGRPEGVLCNDKRMEISKREAKIKLIIIAIKAALPSEAQCSKL
jgi:hypothetical protein